jgi:hypothetical protein
MPILLVHRVEQEHKSWAYFLAVHTSRVGGIFVGETERHLRAPKNDYRHIWALRHKIGEIDPLCIDRWKPKRKMSSEHWKNLIKGSLWHIVYACGKRMRFQSQLGQTKVDFNNQGKNAPQCVAFWLEIFLFKIEIACGKKLKRCVPMSL